MLLDMVMLSSGCARRSRAAAVARLPAAPRAEGNAAVRHRRDDSDASDAISRARGDPGRHDRQSRARRTAPRRESATRTITATALGIDPAVQGDYEVLAGPRTDRRERVVASDGLPPRDGRADRRHALGRRGVRSAASRLHRAANADVVGRAHFLYMAAEQRAVALPLADAAGDAGRGRDAIARRSSWSEQREGERRRVLHRIEREVPRVSAISTETAMRQVDERLSYFRQLALILGAVSLRRRLSARDDARHRVGERAARRDRRHARDRRGASRASFSRSCSRGSAIMIVGALAGLGLGLVTARYLNSILASFPGLPAAIDFFQFEPRDAWTALGMLVGRWNPRRRVSVVARRIASDRDDVARRGRRVSERLLVDAARSASRISHGRASSFTRCAA